MRALITILFMILGHFAISQNSQLPYFLIQNGDTIGVVVSIEQAQKIDNGLELLELFKELQIDCDNLDLSYVKVVNALGEEIVSLKDKSKQQDDLIAKKNNELANIKSANSSLDSACITCEELVVVREGEIRELKREVFRQKVSKIVSVGANVGLAIAIFFILKN